jgi:hypothetical protein
VQIAKTIAKTSVTKLVNQGVHEPGELHPTTGFLVRLADRHISEIFTKARRQSTREEFCVLAGISLKEPVCGVYPAQHRDGQFLGVRPCEAHTSINVTSDLTIVRSKLPTFRAPPVMDGFNNLSALSPMWRSA